MRFMHLDAAQSAFFERELEHVKSMTFDVRFPELRGREFVPVSNEVDPGAESVTYQQFDRRGQAKVISNNAKDIPRVDIFGNEFTRPVRELGAAYGWTLKEVLAAQKSGRNLNASRAMAARRSIEELVDSIAAFGSPDHGIATGFTNDANVTIGAATGTWSTLTPAQIITDVGGMVSNIMTNTLTTEVPNTLLLPVASYVHIATTPKGTDTDTTILRFLLASFPMLNAIEHWYRLDTAGAGSVPRAIMYDRSPDKVVQDIPMEFQQLDPQARGLEFEVPTWAMTAGVQIPYPRSIRYLDGV